MSNINSNDGILIVNLRRIKFAAHAIPATGRITVTCCGYNDRGKRLCKLKKYLKPGLSLNVPWNEDVSIVRLKFVHISDENINNNKEDDMLLGESEIVVDRAWADEPFILNLHIRHPTVGRIGKIFCSLEIERQNFSSSSGNGNNNNNLSNTLLPSFKFNPLNRHIGWDRIKALPLNRIVDTSDISTLLTCIDDVASGNAYRVGKKADPSLLKSISIKITAPKKLLLT